MVSVQKNVSQRKDILTNFAVKLTCFSLSAAPLSTYTGQTKTKKLCSQMKYLRKLDRCY